MIGGIGSTFDYEQARWMDDSTAAQEVNGVTEENNVEAPNLGFNLDAFTLLLRLLEQLIGWIIRYMIHILLMLAGIIKPTVTIL